MPHLLSIFRRHRRRRIPPPPASSGGTQPEIKPSPQKQLPTKPRKFFSLLRSPFRLFPSLTPKRQKDSQIHNETHMTGTLFGRTKTNISLAIQENPHSHPIVLLELAIPTATLLQEMAAGHVRIALECRKQQSLPMPKLVDEPVWTMYCNGRKTGYGRKKEPLEDDLSIKQQLHHVSMGVGVMPREREEAPEGELTYMRAPFTRAVGSTDAETYYMLNPDRNSEPELSIYFLRI